MGNKGSKVNHRLKGHAILAYGEQGLFAEAVGVSAPLLSRVINGHVSLPQAEQERWARLLGVSVEEIFPRAGE